MNFFHHKYLGNHLLQLCPKVVKHSVGEHVPLNTVTMDFNLSRDSNIFVDYLTMLSVTYDTVVSKYYMKLKYQLQSMWK